MKPKNFSLHGLSISGKSSSPSVFSSSTLMVRMNSAIALRRAFVISSMFMVSNGMMLGWFDVFAEQQVGVRRHAFQVAHFGDRRLSALNNRGVAAASYDRLVSDDDGRARLDGVVDLMGKLRIDAEARRDLLGGDAAATARHTHPPPRSADRSQRALPGGCAFEQREDMVAKLAESADLG